MVEILDYKLAMWSGPKSPHCQRPKAFKCVYKYIRTHTNQQWMAQPVLLLLLLRPFFKEINGFMLNVLYKYVQTLVFHLHSYDDFGLHCFCCACNCINSRRCVVQILALAYAHTSTSTHSDWNTITYNNLKWNENVFS